MGEGKTAYFPEKTFFRFPLSAFRFMKWPQLVKPWTCNAEMEIHLTGGLGADGIPEELAVLQVRCSYSEKMRQVLDTERRLISLEAGALVDGDIAPEQAQISGWVLVQGVRREIHRAERARNPDNTVNFTRLELI